MALRKILGLETEFGILHRGRGDTNPIAASSKLINAYVSTVGQVGSAGSLVTVRVGWDFVDETPSLDARGNLVHGSYAPEVETHLVNAVLTNGARYYVDHAHPELSAPECADALDVVLYDRAAELILQDSMAAVNATLPEGEEIVVYKNNSDRKGNSYGTHENYLMDRTVPFSSIVAHVTPHFITRQLYTGAGKVGSEAVGVRSSDVPFQITQRADFFEEEVGLETTLKRPIVNTRDEPHADAKKYRRLHVIVGDANLAQVATFLKVGTTAIVLCMIEDDALGAPRNFADPVRTLREVSYDLTLRKSHLLDDGTTITALEHQWELFRHASAYAERVDLVELVGSSAPLVLRRWEEILTGLESDPFGLAGQLDWVAKLRLFEAYRERNDLAWDDARLAAMDLQYHDIRPGRSLAAKVGLEALVDDDAARVATTEPPADTRAYFRGRCLQRWADRIIAANWDSMVFDVGGDPLRRVPMMEPTRGTAAHVGSLLDDCATPAELLARLGT